MYLPGNGADTPFILSASADRMLKIWDLRNAADPLDSVKLPDSIEDFCFLPTPSHEDKSSQYLLAASGSLMNLIRIGADQHFA